MKRKFRWGILSTAGIARKNWKAIRNSKNGVVTAVASRDAGRSRQFIKECQAEAPFPTPPRALGSYEELISDDEIDAVYIPLPTGIRKEWVIRAAQAHKHVVCEKPCASSVGDLVEMIDACRSHRVQFMDGVMFMHSRRLGLVRAVLDDGRTIGRLRRVSTEFDFRAPDDFFENNIRVQYQLEPFGCLGDLGWYCIRFALWVARFALPSRVTGRVLSETPKRGNRLSVPTEFCGELFFEDGMSSSFYCSFITELQQWASISGALGSLYIPDFVVPFSGKQTAFETRNPAFEVQGCDFEMKPNIRRRTANEHANSHPTAQESNLFRRFAEQAGSGTLNSEWPDMALKTQQVMEACLESARAAGSPTAVGARKSTRSRPS